MWNIFFGVFLILHGIVHVIYYGHASRWFEVKQGLAWPDGSWALGRFLGGGADRTTAAFTLVAAAIAFILGAIGVFASQEWYRPVTAGAAVVSALVFIFFWNGKTEMLDGQGLFAVLINMAILVIVLGFRWPQVGS